MTLVRLAACDIRTSTVIAETVLPALNSLLQGSSTSESKGFAAIAKPLLWKGLAASAWLRQPMADANWICTSTDSWAEKHVQAYA